MNSPNHIPENATNLRAPAAIVPQTPQISANIQTRTKDILSDKETLPIAEHLPQIVETIENNHVLVLEGPTGSGKSTQLAPALAKAGYEVILTQPRRLAAKSLAKRIQAEQKHDLPHQVGYHIGGEVSLREETKITVCTDGLQLVKELVGKNATAEKGKILILDEVHEWNVNIETLIAWVKKQIQDGIDYKIVLMSATLDRENLVEYFNAEGINIASKSIEGRMYPVTHEQASPAEKIDKIIEAAQRGEDVLVFEPSVKRIRQTIKALKESGTDAAVIPLHGSMLYKEQKKAFRTDLPVPRIIVATNVAETSLSIPGITTVVDSGQEIRVEVQDGVESVSYRQISKANCLQRAGRAGRFGPGRYILCSDLGLETRRPYPEAAICRSLLDNVTLKLARANIDIEEMEFVHQPAHTEIKNAKQVLKAIGALNQYGEITKLGEEIAKLPVGARVGRMILEALDRECLDPVLTIAACLQADTVRRGHQWTALTREKQSDHLAELDVFNAADYFEPHEYEKRGISAIGLKRAKSIRQRIVQALTRLENYRDIASLSKNKDRESILKSVLSGLVDRLYGHRGNNLYGSYSRDESGRKLDINSALWQDPTPASLIVGDPLDREARNRRGRTLRFNEIRQASAVTPDLIAEIAPHLVTTKAGNHYWCSERQRIVRENKTYYGNELIKSGPGARLETDKAVRAFCSHLLNQDEIKALCPDEDDRKLYRQYLIKSRQSLPTLNSLIIEKWTKVLGPLAITSLRNFQYFCEQHGIEQLTCQIEEFLTPETVARIDQESPDSVTINGHRIEIGYNEGIGGKYRSINLDRNAVLHIPPEDFDRHISPDGAKISFRFEGRLYPAYTQYDYFYKLIVAQALSKEWEGFLSKRQDEIGSFAHDPQKPLPPLPRPIIYHKPTGALAYPAHKVNLYGQPSFLWLQSKDEADRLNTEAQAKWREPQIHNEMRDYERKITKHLEQNTKYRYYLPQEVQRQLEELRKKLDSNIYHRRNYDSWDDLKNRIENCLQGLKDHISELKQKAASPDVLSNFSASNAYVITPEGHHRDPDFDQAGQPHWIMVQPEELAMVVRNGKLEYQQMPASGLQPPQRLVITDIRSRLKTDRTNAYDKQEEFTTSSLAAQLTGRATAASKPKNRPRRQPKQQPQQATVPANPHLQSQREYLKAISNDCNIRPHAPLKPSHTDRGFIQRAALMIQGEHPFDSRQALTAKAKLQTIILEHQMDPEFEPQLKALRSLIQQIDQAHEKNQAERSEHQRQAAELEAARIRQQALNALSQQRQSLEAQSAKINGQIEEVANKLANLNTQLETCLADLAAAYQNGGHREIDHCRKQEISLKKEIDALEKQSEELNERAFEIMMELEGMGV